MQFKRSSNLFQVSLESLFSINVFSQWILRVEAFDTWLAVIIHSQMGVGIGMCHGYQVMEICARHLCVFFFTPSHNDTDLADKASVVQFQDKGIT